MDGFQKGFEYELDQVEANVKNNLEKFEESLDNDFEEFNDEFEQRLNKGLDEHDQELQNRLSKAAEDLKYSLALVYVMLGCIFMFIGGLGVFMLNAHTRTFQTMSFAQKSMIMILILTLWPCGLVFWIVRIIACHPPRCREPDLAT